MNVLTACVPSAQLCPDISKAFAKFGIQAEASSTPPSHQCVAEHLPCPIEPTEKHHLWIIIHDNTPVVEFLEATFLNAAFVMAIMPFAKTEDDLLALECLVTACSARTITQAFLKHTSPMRLQKAAISEGCKINRRHLAEQILGVPNLSQLLVEYADSLVAGPHPATMAS
jgi:hypothetical protein